MTGNSVSPHAGNEQTNKQARKFASQLPQSYCELGQVMRKNLWSYLGPLHTWLVKLRGRWPNSSYFWARGEGMSPLKYIMFSL